MLVNRKAGAGRGRAIVERVVEALGARGLRTTLISEIQQLHDATQAALEAGNLRGVLSAGGDGTICAALNHTPSAAPLAVLPLGTENLLARYVGHGRSANSVVELLTSGVVVALDAAEANGRKFCIVLSAGLDSEVVRLVHENRRGNITHLAYVAPVLRSVAAYPFPRIKMTSVTAGEPEFSATGCWSFAVNLPRYALGLPIAPGAVGTDGLLDACVLERGSLQSGLWYLANLVRQRHHLMDTVHTARERSFRLEALGGETITYQIDGDPGGVLPVEVTSLPGRLELIVTAQVAGRLGFALPDLRD